MRTDWNSDWVLKGTHSQAKERVRKALNGLGLEIAFDADLAELLQRRTGVRLSRISVFGVCCPFLLLEGIGADPAATLLQPMHLVIRESRDSAVISIVSPAALRTSGVPPVVAIPIHRTLSRLAQALEGAGARRIVTHRVEDVPDGDPVQLRCEEILPR